MKQYTDEEIIDKCVEIWDAQHEKHYMMGWEHADSVKVLKNLENIVEIKLECMYEAPCLNLEVLRQLADFFETDNINDDDKFSYGGCETCDYGSSYGYTLSIRPMKD